MELKIRLGFFVTRQSPKKGKNGVNSRNTVPSMGQ